MDALLSIEFFIDENQPAEALGAVVTGRGHRAPPVQVGFKDPAILVTAEQVGAVIITADTWFLRELYRLPAGHQRRRYVRAGVVQVPGEWEAARSRIFDYRPLVEAVCRLRRQQEDRRIGIDLSAGEIRVVEAKPMPPSAILRPPQQT